MRYLDKLEEAKKRGYTFPEIDAYARGRERATIERRRREFEEFYSDPKKKKPEKPEKPKKPELEEARVDKGKPYGQKKRARSRRDLDRAYQHASDTGEGKVGKMIRSPDFRKTAVLAARVRRQDGEPSSRPLKGLVKAEKKLKAESYIQIGDILAEALTGKAKRVAKKLRTSAENEYKSAEVGEASGESAESVTRKAARAHRRMATAQKIEDKG
jgi:hypothetical protein